MGVLGAPRVGFLERVVAPGGVSQAVRGGAVGLPTRSVIYCLFCPVSRSGELQRRRAARPRDPPLSPAPAPAPGRVPGERGAVTAPARGARVRPQRFLLWRGAWPAGAGSDWREPSPSAQSCLISSVRIGKRKKKKKPGKPDLTLQLSAPGELGNSPKNLAGWKMRLKENPHPRNEAKPVTVRGQVYGGMARGRWWMGS